MLDDLLDQGDFPCGNLPRDASTDAPGGTLPPLSYQEPDPGFRLRLPTHPYHSVRGLQRAGSGLRSLAAPVLDTKGDFAELVLAMLGVAARLERRRIAERTARGRAGAKANGVKVGRKPILTPHQQKEARKRAEAGWPQRSVARSYNVSQATISRLSV